MKKAFQTLFFYSLVFLLFLIFIPFNSFSQDDDCYQSESKKVLNLYDQAIEHYRHKRFIDANGLLKQVIKIEPEFVDPYYVLAMINIERKKYNVLAAEKYLIKVIELCPLYDIDAYYWLGSIYYGAEKWDLASRYLKEYLKDVSLIDDDGRLVEAKNMLKYAEFNRDFFSNPVPFNPRIVDGISTSADEYLVIISPDGELALYTRGMKVGPNKNELIQKERYKEMFCSSQKLNDKFDKGGPLDYPFNQFENEGGATISIDNKTLYYSVAKYESGYLNTDIYYTENLDGYWSDIESIGDEVNLSNAWDTQPTITSDGKTLYFVSDRPGGYGGYDIWMTKKGENGSWSKPKNMGPTINTSKNEKSPFIHSDNQTLYFASDGWIGLGGYDIFFIRLNQEKPWSKPMNIGYPINTKDDESSFFVSTNGHFGYFASNKLNEMGGWDLFSFDLYEDARPEQVLFLKGILKDEKTDQPIKDARIELKNVKTKRITEIPVDTVTGEYVAVSLFKNDLIMTVKKQGYAFESHYFAQEDTVNEEPVELEIEIKEIVVGESYKLNDIHFPTNSYELSSTSKTIIDGFIEFLSENPIVEVSIEGHTDNVGSKETNQVLSENRANAVYTYLIENGINKNRLRYQGFGEDKPVASNDTFKGRALNRRTVFVILKK
ncbi:OmpA family protein [candidate division KSB1 bacterium]